MGVSEGAYTPASIAATVEASKPSRRGFNLGIQQELFAVLGLGFGPIIATQLLTVVPSWREVFLLVSLPGFLLAWLMFRTLRDTQGSLQSEAVAGRDERWQDVFQHRNVPLNMIGMCCMLTCLLVMSTMVPSYLVDYQHLGTQQMGFVMSGIGFGGFLGQLLLPGLSDRVGRKTVVLVSYVGTFLSLALMLTVGADPVLLFALLFLASFFNNSMICLNVGPLTSEAVSASYTSTATGIVVGTGEVFGGGIAPSLAGFIAKHFGIQFTFYLALGGLLIGFLFALFLRETAPARIDKAALSAAH
jgi:MFS family permease